MSTFLCAMKMFLFAVLYNFNVFKIVSNVLIIKEELIDRILCETSSQSQAFVAITHHTLLPKGDRTGASFIQFNGSLNGAR